MFFRIEQKDQLSVLDFHTETHTHVKILTNVKKVDIEN